MFLVDLGLVYVLCISSLCVYDNFLIIWIKLLIIILLILVMICLHFWSIRI